MGQREAVSPRAEFLHAASRPRGSATHNLSWVAASPGARWRCRRHTLRAAWRTDCPCSQHNICNLPTRDAGELDLLWGESGGAGHRNYSALALGAENPAQETPYWHHYSGFSSEFCFRGAISDCDCWSGSGHIFFW